MVVTACFTLHNGVYLQDTGQYGIALRQLLQVIQPADDRAQLAVRHRHALPHPILGVVGKLYGVKRPDIDPRELHRQHSGFISGIAINDRRLNRQHVFILTPSNETLAADQIRPEQPSDRQPLPQTITGLSTVLLQGAV